MRIAAIFFALIIGIGGGFFLFRYVRTVPFFHPVKKEVGKNVEKPLEKYSFDRLRKRQFEPSEITFGKVVKDDTDFTSRMFYFSVDGKRVSGLVNIPQKGGTYPILVMFRGFVDKSVYTPGEGDRRTAEYFVKQGFITLTPDFLGYGESDAESQDPMEGRFQTYTTSLELLSSIVNFNHALESAQQGSITADAQKIGIWGHSNGGHIALSVLSITGKSYPTVLWNPVSKLFPYSILYFTDEYDDHGKGLIQLVANFEKEYDSEKYSPPNYYKYIHSPMQLNQAVDDEEVPVRWSNQLYDTLKGMDKDITYFTYPGENHNFNKGSWDILVKRGSDFYKDHLSK